MQYFIGGLIIILAIILIICGWTLRPGDYRGDDVLGLAGLFSGISTAFLGAGGGLLVLGILVFLLLHA